MINEFTAVDFATNWFGLPLKKVVAFSNDTGTVSLFTITGDVIVRIIPVVTTNLTSAAAANVRLGVVGNTDAMIVDSIATTLVSRNIWVDQTPTNDIEPTERIRNYIITNSNDVVMTLDDQVDTGVVAYYCFWMPLAGTVEVA